MSGDFIAHPSYRVTGTAIATGHAAGVAAALCANLHISSPKLKWEDIKTKLGRKSCFRPPPVRPGEWRSRVFDPHETPHRLWERIQGYLPA